MAADSLDEKLGDGVESKLRRLGNEDVAGPHQKVRAVHRLENVLVAEQVYSLDFAVYRVLTELLGLFPVVEVRPGDIADARDHPLQVFPDVLVVADIDVEHCLVRLDVGHELIDDSCEDLFLRTCPADGKEESHGLAGCFSGEASCAVFFNVCNELVVNIMSCVLEAVFGHRVQDLLAVHAVADTVALISVMCLDRMDASLCVMKRHRPVVGDRVHDVLHACVYSCLRGPDVCGDYGDVLGNVLINGCHEFCVLLVGRVIGKLPEAFVVKRLPDDLVEELRLLRDPRTLRVQIVLRGDDLGTGRLLV